MRCALVTLLVVLAFAATACGGSGRPLKAHAGQSILMKAPEWASFTPGTRYVGRSVVCTHPGGRLVLRVPEPGHQLKGSKTYLGVRLLTLTITTKPDGTVRAQCLGVIPR